MAFSSVPKLAFAALSFLLLSGAYSITPAAEISAVTASGRAALSNQPIKQVRRIALEDALYLAAIRAGTQISGAAISSNGVLVRDVVSLNTNAQLVDFSIIGEEQDETHYVVAIEAYFAKKSRSQCQNPRFPSVLLLKSRNLVESNVHIRHRELAAKSSQQIEDLLLRTFPGQIIDNSNLTFEEYQKSASKHRLFSYAALQTNQTISASADFIIEPVVRVGRTKKIITTSIKMNVYLGSELSKYNVYEADLTYALPEKSPFKTINVLSVKEINPDIGLAQKIVESFKRDVTQIACQPIEGRLQSDSGDLTFPYGQDVGLKPGSMAYVTGGSESWSLLEVTKVFPTSSLMSPINNIQTKARLFNQNVRIIEGTIR